MAYIYDSEQQLPIFGPNEGDIAFVRSTNTLYTYVDLSPTVYFSYDFNGSSSLVTKNKVYTPTNDFTIDFWSYAAGISNKPHFVFYDGENINSLQEVANSFPVVGEYTVENVPYNPSNYVSGALYFNGSSKLIIDASHTVNTKNLDWTNQYTLSFFVNNKSPSTNCIVNYDNFGQTIVALRNDKVVINGMSYSGIGSGNFSKNEWNNRRFYYDGFNYYYGADSSQQYDNALIQDYQISKNTGSLTDFITTKNAAFQFKTNIPVNAGNGILFSLGEGSNSTKLEVLSGDLKLTAKSLTTSISLSDPQFNSWYSVDQFGDSYIPAIISWDYRIKNTLESIRLGIRPDTIDAPAEIPLQGYASSIGSVFNSAWASTVISSDNSAFSTVDVRLGDIEELPYYSYQAIDEGITKSLINFTAIDGNNVRVSPRLNQARHYFRINDGIGTTYFNQNGSNVYYFEMIAEDTTDWNGLVRPFFVSNDVPISIGEGASTDMYDRRKTQGDNPEDFTDGSTYFVHPGGQVYSVSPPLNQGVVTFYPDTLLSNRIISCIIDETNNTFYTFTNGSPVNRREWGPNLLTVDNPFSLGFVLYGPYYRFNRTSASFKINFDRADWKFEPLDLYTKALTLFGDTNPTIVGGISTGFLNSNVAPTWATSSNTSDLKYYNQAFPFGIQANDSSGILTIGANEGRVIKENYIDGTHYAAGYIASTGGQIRYGSTSTDLQTLISASGDGDVILLAPGTYNASSVSTTIPVSLTAHTIFSKNVLICGTTNDPNDVIINYTTPNDNAAIPIFTGSKLCQLGFLTFNKNTTNTTSNAAYVAMFTDDFGGKAQNVIFDFNNKYTSLLYNPSQYPVYRHLVDCVFKNYVNFVASKNGRLDLFVIDGCKFEKDCSDLSRVKTIGNSDTNLSFDSYGNYSQYPFIGYISDLELRIGNTHYDSSEDQLIENSKKRIADSNSIVLLETDRYGDTILRLDDNGTIHVNDKKYSGVADITNKWVHHRISQDSNGIRVYVDGLQIDSILDSVNLDSTSLYIGKAFEFDQNTNSLINNFAQELIKDFALKSTTYTDSVYSVPSQNKLLADADDIIWTANDLSPDLAIFNQEGTIDLVQFSPYTSAEKGWTKYMQVNTGYDSVFIDNINGLDVIEPTYDSMYDNPMNVYLKLVDVDDAGDSVRWTSDIFSVDNAVLVKQKGNNEFMVVKSDTVDSIAYPTSSSMITFIPHNINSLDDSISQFYIAPQNNDILHTLPLIAHYGKYGLAFKITSTIIHLRYIYDMYQIDSTFDSTGYL